MKLIVMMILTLDLIACSNSTDNKLVDIEIAKDDQVQADSFYINGQEIGGDTEYKRLYWCDFDRFVNDPNTSKLAVDIYLDKDWNLNNDNEALALLDSLTAMDKTARPFFFKVVTKTAKKSDGYFSEGLGYAGYHYLLNYTQEFASYFDNKQCHTDDDLATWADIVIMEFFIIGEGRNDKQIVDDYIKELKANCKVCTITQEETINRIGLELIDKWSNYLKHLE